MDLLRQDLLGNNREPDGLLHASGDLVGPLRHSQLRLAGAPARPNSLAQQIRLATGTMWHDRMHNSIVASGVPFMQEVNVTPWLPEGWGGTADWLFWDDGDSRDDYGYFELRDLKTCKPEGLKWLLAGGVKVEHQWQLSAYYHALTRAGFTLSDTIGVMYLPMGDTTDDTVIEPLMLECEIVDYLEIQAVMASRWDQTQQYLSNFPGDEWVESYINDDLAPAMPREQKTFWVGRQSIWDVKLVPHWSAMFCPYDNALCDCSEQGVTKIGHYTLEGVYVPRNGYEDIAPEAIPSEQDVRARRDAILTI